MREIQVINDLVETNVVISDNTLLDRPSYPRNVDKMWTSASQLLFDMSELLELLDNFVDGPLEHFQTFRNVSVNDAVSEKFGNGGAIMADLHC